jgi:hypothetical protein
MSAKPCDNCTMIMINYRDRAKLEVREFKARSLLVGACTSRPLLRFDFEACALRLNILNIKLLIPLATVFYPLYAIRVALSRISFSMLPKRTPS